MNILAPIDWPNSAFAIREASTKWVLSRPASAAMVRLSRSLGSEKSALAGEFAGQEFVGIDHHGGGAGPHGGKHLLGAGDHDVAAEHEIGAAGRDADRVNVLGLFGDPHMAEHRTALLREPRHVEHADALALEMCRHAQYAADGDDAGAADAGDDDIIGLVDRRKLRLRQRRAVRDRRRRRCPFSAWRRAP